MPVSTKAHRPPIVALLGDFGTTDPYVGVMKGVVLSICPTAQIVDVCHEVPPQDVLAGALMLQAAYRYFPQETVFIAVVDPGVGSARRAIAAHADGRIFVCPDNGLLSGVRKRGPGAHGLTSKPWHTAIEAAVELTERKYWLPRVSQTFHGRDIFAPVAAHIAAGVPLDALGPPAREIVTIPLSDAIRRPDGWEAHIIYIDRFGNAVTDLREDALVGVDARGIRLSVAGRSIEGLSQSYADVPEGELVALVGSWGYLEIAVRNGSAAERLRLASGDIILVILGT